MFSKIKAALVTFNTVWLIGWCLVAVADLTTIFLIPFRWWFLQAFITFGTLEGIGIFAGDPHLPPLTDVIRRYLPSWCALMLIDAFWGAGFYAWDHPVRLVPTFLMFGLFGWFTAHFLTKYVNPQR